LSQKIVSETLRGLGLTERDSEVFIFLAKKGPVLARDMLRTMGINKAQLYRSLKNLQGKGIAESTLELPARFTAVSFEQVLDLFIKTKKDETRRIEERREVVLAHWRSLAVGETPILSDKFMVIEGENYIYSKIDQMIRTAKKQILLSASDSGIIQAEKSNIVENMIDSKVPFKILTNVTPKNLPIIEKAIKKMGVFAQKWNGRHTNLAERLFPRFVLRDDDELIFLITSREETTSNPKTDTGLWTNNKALIDAFKTFFDQLWRDATDVQEKINELKTGKSPPETIFVRDAEEAYQKYLSLIRGARKEIILMTPAKGLENLLGLKSILDGWKNRNIAVRIMAPITKENEDITRKLSEYCDIRHIQMNYLGEVIVDKKQLLHFKAPSDVDLHVPSACFSNSFYTDDSEYVCGRVELFNDLWNNSPSAIEELKRNEARFRSLYENSFDAILLTSPDGCIFSANPAAQQMFGMSEDEVKKASRSGTLVVDEKAKAELREGKRKGKAKAELTFRRKDGSTFQGETTEGHFTDADGIRKVSLIIRDTTQRKNAEDALRRTEVWKATSFYTRNLIEASLDPLVTINCFCKITDVNRATELVTECSREQLIGSDFSDFFTEPQKAKMIYQQVLEQGFTKDYSLAIRSKFGKITDVVFNASVFRNEEGEIQGVFAAARDITKIKEAERVLEKKQQELSLILDSSPTIIFYKDIEGKFVQVNRAFGEALNLPKEKLLGKTVFDLYPAKIAQGMTKDDSEVFESKRAKLATEEPYISPTGLRWIRTSKIPILDENNIPKGLIGFSEEITERKKAEENIKESEERFHSVLNNSLDVIYRVNLQTVSYEFMSPSCKKLLGFEPEELMKMSNEEVLSRIHPEDLPLLQADLARIQKEGNGFSEYRFLRKDGSYIRYLNYMVVTRDANGKPLYRDGYGKDVTESKE
jgi:PAS domain S-box-containing protein